MTRNPTRREDVLAFMAKYTAENGFAPSVGEIAQELRTVKSNIHYHLKVLEEEGRVRHRANVARSWTVNLVS